MLGGFHLQLHLVVGHLTRDHQAGFVHLGEALDQLVHLAGMHEHAPHLGGLIGTTHPAFDALIGAPRGAVARQDGGEVAGAKTDEGVVGVQGGHHQLAHLAFGHGVTSARAHDFHDHALVQDQAFAGRGFVGDEANVGRGIALVSVHALGDEPVAQRRRASLATDQGLAQTGQGHAGFSSLLQNDFQKTGCAAITCGLQVQHGLQLLLGLPRATWKHAAPQSMRTAFHDGPGGCEVVAETVVNEFTRAKTGGVQGTRHPPVVAVTPFGLVNGARTGKHAWHVGAKTHR